MSNSSANNQSLASLMSSSAPKKRPAKGAKGAKVLPIGTVSLKLAGITLFTRSIWKESLSETEFLNELNDLSLSDADKAELIFKALLEKCEVEINTRASSDLTLEEIMKL